MAKNNPIQDMLDLISVPAFTVTDNTICLCNKSALLNMIEPGTSISNALGDAQEDYNHMSNTTSLFATIHLPNGSWDATIIRSRDYDIFQLDSKNLNDHLKAMTLVSTELRSTVANLVTLSQMMLPQLEDESLGACVNHELSKVLRVLNNITNAMRFSEDRTQHLEERNICAIMNELLSECAALLEKAGIRLNISIHACDIFTMVDLQMLRQAIYGILNNAAKYSQEGDSIDATLSKSGSTLRLSITDHGPGVDESVRKTMFHRYTRHPALESWENGLGLGMVIARFAARTHGGTLLVDSPAGGGTRITLTMAIRSSNQLKLKAKIPMVVPSPDNGLVMLSNVLPKELYTIVRK